MNEADCAPYSSERELWETEVKTIIETNKGRRSNNDNLQAEGLSVIEKTQKSNRRKQHEKEGISTLTGSDHDLWSGSMRKVWRGDQD